MSTTLTQSEKRKRRPHMPSTSLPHNIVSTFCKHSVTTLQIRPLLWRRKVARHVNEGYTGRLKYQSNLTTQPVSVKRFTMRNEWNVANKKGQTDSPGLGFQYLTAQVEGRVLGGPVGYILISSVNRMFLQMRIKYNSWSLFWKQRWQISGINHYFDKWESLLTWAEWSAVVYYALNITH